MAYVEGESLARLISFGKQFTIAEAIDLLQDACEGAAAIWATGTAHRDLSLNNLIVGSDGHLTIVDLGLCRNVDDDTITTFPMPGTPGWMAPEQLGLADAHGDWRSDQFVLGLVGYRLATSLSPFHGRSRLELWQAPHSQTIRPADEVDPSVPSPLARLLQRMLEREPHRRFPRPDVLLAEIGIIQLIPVASSTAPPPADFHLIVGHVKNFIDEEFLTALAADGMVLDGAMTRARPDLVTKARNAHSLVIADPVTHNGRSPLAVRSESYSNLPYGSVPVPTDRPNAAQITEWAQWVLAAYPDHDVVIAPYWYAHPGEIDWVNASLAAGSEARQQVSVDPKDTRQVLTGLAVASGWVSHDGNRNSLLAAITAMQVQDLYLMVHTNQPSFRPLQDRATLIGFRDLLQVLRESGTNVIVGCRATCGLLFLAMGATGWSTGISSIQQNMQPHHEEEIGGGPAQDRCYVPRLLSVLTTASVVNFLHADPTVLDPRTSYVDQLLATNPQLTDLTTEQRILLHQHNITAQRVQTLALAMLPLGPRIALLRYWLDDARTLFANLPAGTRPDETFQFVTEWQSVL
jgi:hypothetical protein